MPTDSKRDGETRVPTFTEAFIEMDPDEEIAFVPGLCSCKGRDPNDHELHITEGSADVFHTGCGLPISDYPEDITVENPVPVRVEWVPDGCDPPGGWHGVDHRCDCGYYPRIMLRGPQESDDGV